MDLSSITLIEILCNAYIYMCEYNACIDGGFFPAICSLTTAKNILIAIYKITPVELPDNGMSSVCDLLLLLLPFNYM